MPPRRMLHHQNRVICSPEANFYDDVQKLIHGLRGLMKDHLGGAHFVTLKDTVSDEKANYMALELALNILTKHNQLQVEGTDNNEYHEMVIHMALSELDQSYDSARVH